MLYIIYAFSDIFTGNKEPNEIVGVHNTDELHISTPVPVVARATA
jgi:hypothetical protein